MSKQDWRFVGTMGVDAGLCWVGDPCYIANFDTEAEEVEGSKSHNIESWHEFVDLLHPYKKDVKSDKITTMIPNQAWSLNYALGHEGLGVCVSTGYGDGSYPVFARIGDEGRCMEVRAVFDTPPRDSDIYEVWCAWAEMDPDDADEEPLTAEDDKPFVGDDDHEKGSV